MPYCQECDKRYESGGYCPECGSPLVQPTSGGEDSGTGTPPGDGHGGSDRPGAGGDQHEAGGWGEPTDRRGEDAGGWGEPAGSGSGGGHGHGHDHGGRTGPPSGGDETDYFEKGAFGFSFTYPVADGWKQMLISAGMLFLASFVFLPVFFVYGYAYRLGRATIRGDPRPPVYDDWGGIFKDGLLLFVAGLPVGVAVLAVALAPVAVGLAADVPGVVLLAVPLYLAGAYAAGGVLPTFMATGSVTETYSGLRFLEFVKTADYLKAIVLGLLAVFGSLFALFILFFILVITIVGILLAFPLMFVAQPFVLFIPFLMFGYFYREAMLDGRAPEIERGDTLGAEL